MPTLINELSPQQRSWIFETFGHYGEHDELSNGEASSDDLESQYIHQNTTNSKNNEVSTPVRRNSNESIINYGNDPSPMPYINMSHPFGHSSITDLPPLSSTSDPAPDDNQENRISIFRRSISTKEPCNTSPVREVVGESKSHPVPSSTRKSSEKTEKPHPGSIWSPLNDKIIMATPPTADRPVYGSINTGNDHYEYSPNMSHLQIPNSFNIFPRPPFARSVNHTTTLAMSTTTTTTLAIRPAGSNSITTLTPTATSTSSSIKRQHHAINDDPNYQIHHHHHPYPPHLHPVHPHHHMYAMRPMQHQHHPTHQFHHSATALGHSKVPIPSDSVHHPPNGIQTPHHSSNDIININKPIVFPHSDDKLTWQQSFDNLKIYKRIYGDCNVPQKYKMNVKLGGWVNKQRKKKKNPSKYGKLTEAQIKAMEDIGFKWIVETVQEAN